MSEFIKTQLSSQSIKDLLRPLSAKPKKGVAKQTALSEQDYEQSLVPLFDYFDSTVSFCIPKKTTSSLGIDGCRTL
jgi:hypothetical protein